MRRSLIGCLLPLICLLAWGFGCSDEDGPRPCDWNHVGAVHGYVLAAGEPVAPPAQLRLSSYSAWNDPTVRVTTATDSTGWYEFLVPQGTYALMVSTDAQDCYWTSTGLVGVGSAAQDTVFVSREPLELDITLGVATLAIAMPSALNNQSITISLGPVWCCLMPSGRVTATVHDGFWNSGSIPIAPGTYQLAMYLSDQRFWIPGTIDEDSASQLEVSAGEHVTFSETLRAPWILRGEIRGAWQSLALSPPPVIAIKNNSYTHTQTSAAADGSFRLEIYPQIPLRLKIASVIPDRWVGGQSFAEATEFLAAPGESLTIPPIVYSAIECRILPPDPAQDLSAEITLLDAGGHSVLEDNWPVARNPFISAFLDPGTYFLRLTPQFSTQPWCAQWFDRAEEFELATPIEVPPDGGVARITMVLSACGTIPGRGLTANGVPAVASRGASSGTRSQSERSWTVR